MANLAMPENGRSTYSFTNPAFGELRTIDVDGKILFCGKDVAVALGYKDTTNAIKQHCRGVAFHHPITDSLGREQQARFITEGDLYRLIVSSQLPAAQSFESWIFDEVLPSIRKTGGYINGSDITRMELIQIALNAETERLALEAQNKELTPKAEAYDSFLDTTGKYAVGAVAQMLGMGQNKLFRELRNRKIFIATGSRRNTPYQKYLHHFEVIAHEYERSSGEQGCSYTTYVQPSGIDFIRRKLGLPTIDPLIPGLPTDV